MPRRRDINYTDEMKKQRGTFNPEYSDRNDLKLDKTEIGDPPKDFNDFQKDVWNQHRQIVNELQVVTFADIIAFREMVLLYVQAQEANKKLYENPTIFNSTGVEKPSPWLEIYRSCIDRWLIFADKFGLTPRSRQNFMGLTKAKQKETESKTKMQSFLLTKPQIK
jgi:P27 family predicted phage terminase small subunit